MYVFAFSIATTMTQEQNALSICMEKGVIETRKSAILGRVHRIHQGPELHVFHSWSSEK